MRLFWGILALLLTGCFNDKPVTHIAKSGEELRRVSAYEVPDPAKTAVVVLPGDFVFSKGGMRVVVGGLNRVGEARGAILEATLSGVPVAESIVLLQDLVYVAGVERRVRVLRMFMIERMQRPVLRVEGAVVLDDRVIEVARELSFAKTEDTISVTTRLSTLAEEGIRDVRIGSRIAWGGATPFMPSVGELQDEAFHRGVLITAQGAIGASAYAFKDSTLTARAVYEAREASRFLQHTDVVSARRLDLVAKKPVYQKSALTLSRLGMARAARKIGFFREKPFRELWAFVPYRPEGTEVRLMDEDKARLFMLARPDEQGRVVLPIPPGDGPAPMRFVVDATAYGHAPSEATTFGIDQIPSPVLQIPRGGFIRVRARDASSDDPLAVRVRMLGLERTPAPNLGPDGRASGAGDTVIAMRGDAEIAVPAGRYHVIVSHGPEWSLHEVDVDVTETFSPRVTALLTHEVDPGNYVPCDLHLHASPSADSVVSLQDRLASLEAEGIVFAVPTDHNHVTDYAPVARELGISGLRTVTGVEITSWEPAIGHFNAYPFPVDPDRPGNGAPQHLGIEPQKLFRELHTLDPDIVVQINHPRAEGGIGYFSVMSLDSETGAVDPRYSAEFDAIEVFNGFDLAAPERVERVFQDFVGMLMRGQRVAATGSSDSHQVRYQLAGYPRTYAYVPESESSDPRLIVRAIKNGQSFITSGPFLEANIGEALPGSVASADAGKVTLHVRVRAPSFIPIDKIEVLVGEDVRIAETIPPFKKKRGLDSALRFEKDFDLAISEDTFVIVRVSANTSMEPFFGRAGVMPFAFTNPIFVDGDGDGVTPLTRATP